MNILFFQFGNFAEAYARLSAGGNETYRDQRRSVFHAVELAETHIVTFVQISSEKHDTALKHGLRSIGLEGYSHSRTKMVSLIEEIQPDIVICRTPYVPILSELKRRRIRTFPCFGDHFSNATLRQRLSSFRRARVLKGPHISCVSNHNLNASRSMVTVLGIPADKVIPRDWTPMVPDDRVKESVIAPKAPKGFFAGTLREDKGVGDILAAMQTLHARGISFSVTFAGGGDVEYWVGKAEEMGLGDLVDFVGFVPNEEVRGRMHESDVVLVPTQHGYAEGLPNTLIEGLASRSPVVISDHPVFANRLKDERDCMMFPAGEGAALAEKIARLCADDALYARLSAAAGETLQSLHFGVEWTEMIDMFVADPENRSGWVEAHSLAAMAE